MRKRSWLVLMMTTVTLQTAVAQESRRPVPAVPPNYKDKSLATILSFMMPGMGQYYSERGGKGFVIFAAALGGVVHASRPHCDASSFGECDRYKSTGAGYYIAGAAWLWGWLTAAGDAERHNARVLESERFAASYPARDTIPSFPTAAVRR